jgi:hypothetical protein
MIEKMEVISPVGAESIRRTNLGARLDSLEGKTICEAWNGGFKGEDTFPILRELLKERYPGLRIIPFTEFPLSIYTGSSQFQREIAKEIVTKAKEKGCDALITGNGA